MNSTIFGDGQNIPSTFFPESYGAKGDEITDDTTAIQDAITAAQTVNGVVQFGAKTYKITSPLVISSAATLRGVFSAPLVQGVGRALNNVNCSYVSPYLQGTVILQTTANTDILDVTTVGQAVNLRDIGFKFDDSIKFHATGHGIYCYPPSFTDGSNVVRDNGIFNSLWENVSVFGNDSNHYGVYLANGLYNVAENLYVEGGGCLLVEDNSVTATGNMTINGGWFWLVGGGLSNGVYFKSTAKSTTGGVVSHISMFNCQCLPISDGDGSILNNFSGTMSGTLTNGSNVISVSSTSGILLGQTVTGTGIPTGAFVSGITSNTLTLSAPVAASLPFTAASTAAANATTNGAQTLTFGPSLPLPSQYLLYEDLCWCNSSEGCSFESTSGYSAGVFIDSQSRGLDWGVASVNGIFNFSSKDTSNFTPRILKGALSWGFASQGAEDLRMIRFFDYPANPGVDNTAYSAGWGFDGHSVVQHVQLGDGSAKHRWGALDPAWQTSADNSTKFTEWMNLVAGLLSLTGANSGIVLNGFTAATLPSSPVSHQIALVTDALSPVKGSTLTGGGSVIQLVVWNGSNWVVL